MATLPAEGIGPDISVVVPAYNEADKIERTVATLSAALAPLGSYEIVVASDGSNDDTVAIVQRLAAADPRVRGLDLQPNRGKGWAVRQGMLAARGATVVFSDADLAVPATELPRLLGALRAGADVAVGSRAVEGARLLERQGALRQLAGRTFRLCGRLWLGVGVRDSQCGFKAFRGEVVRPLFGRQTLASIVFDVEILYLARRLGLRVVEVPVTWSHNPDSRIRYNLARSLSVFGDLFALRLRHWRQP